MKKIWVVDDEKNIRELIRRYLEDAGFEVRTFSSGEEMFNALGITVPSMFILDIMLPGEDGLTLCRTIREKYKTPIIFVSARGEEFDRVLGLELGGDDYLAKPFSPRELVVRVKNIFKRLDPASEEGNIILANLIVDHNRRTALVGGDDLKLTTREFELLYKMASAPGRSFSREILLDNIWGYDYEGDNRAVDDTVKRLRKKLRSKGALPEIAAVWGYGYRLDV